MTFQTVAAATAALGAVLVFALVQQKENAAAHRLLAVVTVLAITRRTVWPEWTEDPIPLLFPLVTLPLLNFYFKRLTRAASSWQKRDLIEGVPLALGVLWALAAPPSLRELGLVVLTNLVGVCFIMVFFRSIARYEHAVARVVASPERLGLGWLKLLAGLVLVLWTLSVFEMAYRSLPSASWLPSLGLMLGLGALAAYSVRHSRVFDEIGREIAKSEKPSRMPTEQIHGQVAKLESYFREERPYLRSDLRLSELASALELKPEELSVVLNEGLGTNFFGYVNRHRVEEAKRRLADKKYAHMNILGIALDCGFQSKSSFSEAFKKWAGETPSAYRKRLD